MTEELAVPANSDVEFLLLGPFEAYAEGNGTPLDLGPDHEQCLLAVLLAAERKSISRERLIHVVWDDRGDELADATGAVWRLVTRLRRRLYNAGLDGALIGNRATYRLEVSSEHVDLHRFRAMSAQGRELIGRDDRRAGELLQAALRLHRGVPLAGLNGAWADAFRHTITEEYHVAETALYELAIRLGKANEVVPGLMNLFRERPDDESVAWLYMHALYRSGRQGDALAVFREVRQHLQTTIGGDCSEALAGLHHRMLDTDPGLLSAEAVAFPGRLGAGTSPTGRTDDDTGRRTEQDTEPETTEADGEREAPADATAAEPRSQGTSITAHEIRNANVFEAPVTVGNDLNFNAS